MNVNLNKIAEEIVPDYNYKQFVDNVSDIPLPPLYRGALKTFYPTTIKEVNARRKLSRYIFTYNANGSFDFIATRKGQRNGGNNVRLEEAQFNVTITDPSNNFAILKNRNFRKVSENLYVFGEITRIIYINQIYYWQERQPGSFVFNSLYYSAPTTNDLKNADKQGDVNWFEFGSNKYVIANNTAVEFYNNNTLAGLNSWPIRNQTINTKRYQIQDFETVSSFDTSTTAETKPSMLDDSFLYKCFANLTIEPYETVFVEVLWKEYDNKTKFKGGSTAWLGEAFTVPVLKGRVYRVGKLAKSNGVGEFDIVTFAQRTKIKTTRTKRGGNTVYV